MVLVKNWPFFHLFFKANIGQENAFYDILERKNVFPSYKKKKFKKWKNCHFFIFSMVLVKNWAFFQIFSLGNIVNENVFLDILERKNTFLGYKNKKFKKWKNCHFCKGVSYGFGSKLAAFPFFFSQ